MAINSTFYLDAADLTSAVSVYLDSGLNNLAPDGYYGDGTITRQQSSGILLTAEACATCPTPCGTSIGGSGGSGVYKINLDVGSTSADTGAIIITFNPNSYPDGIRATYDGIVYNKLSSPNFGPFQTTNSGHFTILGSTSGTSTCTAWYPTGATLTNDVFLYNPATLDFDPTGTTQTDEIVGTSSAPTLQPDYFLTGGLMGVCVMVIPKTTATPSSLLVEIIGPCTSTGWSFSAFCPEPLPSFSSSTSYIIADIPCEEVLENTYYFAKVHTAVDSYIGINDYVFTDENGEFPLADGFYLTDNVASPNKVIEVVDGVVFNITDCLISL
jgi:hypothetical protein